MIPSYGQTLTSFDHRDFSMKRELCFSLNIICRLVQVVMRISLYIQMKVFRHPVGKNSSEMNQILDLRFYNLRRCVSV